MCVFFFVFSKERKTKMCSCLYVFVCVCVCSIFWMTTKIFFFLHFFFWNISPLPPFFFCCYIILFFHIPTATKFYNNPLTLPHTPSYCVNVCCIHPTDWLVGSRGYQDQKLLFFFCVSPYPLYNLHLDTIKKKGRKKKLKRKKTTLYKYNKKNKI